MPYRVMLERTKDGEVQEEGLLNVPPAWLEKPDATLFPTKHEAYVGMVEYVVRHLGYLPDEAVVDRQGNKRVKAYISLGNMDGMDMRAIVVKEKTRKNPSCGHRCPISGKPVARSNPAGGALRGPDGQEVYFCKPEHREMYLRQMRANPDTPMAAVPLSQLRQKLLAMRLLYESDKWDALDQMLDDKEVRMALAESIKAVDKALTGKTRPTAERYMKDVAVLAGGMSPVVHLSDGGYSRLTLSFIEPALVWLDPGTATKTVLRRWREAAEYIRKRG